MPDSNLIARKLIESPRVICASPSYLKVHGTPNQPEQLVAHEWVIFSLLPTPYIQTLSKNEQQVKIRIHGRFKTNNALTLRSLLLEGSGLGVISEFLIADEVAQGRLVKLLPDFDVGTAGVYAVYPNKEYIPVRVKLFIEYLNKNLQVS